MMTDIKKIEQALNLLREAAALVSSVDAGENPHLKSYAINGLGDARWYLETLRRRLIHASGAECPGWYED